MKRFLSILAAFALVLALAGCVSGQGAKGYKLAKKEIKDAVADNDGYKFGKFTGGNFVHVKKQTREEHFASDEKYQRYLLLKDGLKKLL